MSKYDCISGVATCWHCYAHMEKYAETNSGREVYRCPDCGRKQFYDGAFVPIDLVLRKPPTPTPEKERGKP